MITGKKLIILISVLFLTILLGMAYRYSPYKLEYLGYYDKIWAHRVNSPEKLESALKYFKGVELDLVYNEQENVLDVTHPPVPSIGLSFEKYLSYIDVVEKPYLWLDIKNLNSENKDAILKKLMKLFSEKKYPLDKVLVETRYPEALLDFSELGFKTSYYLPFGLSEMSSDNRNIQLQKITNILDEQPDLAISSNYTDYEIMAKEFPTRDKYFWITSSIRKHGFSTPKKILKDSTVKAVLISYKVIKGHR